MNLIELNRALHQLRLGGMVATLETRLQQAQAESMAPIDLISTLVSDELALVRICGSEECDWLFLDKTKNHRRRWCDMKTCGNRVKARRHYERVKGE